MKRRISRLQELYRNSRYLRQELGAKKFWRFARISPPEHAGSTGKPETILVLAPHPDDEAFGCGGALAIHNARKDSIHIVFIHSGSGGDSAKDNNSKLAEQRKEEAKKAAKFINAEPYFWEIADGTAANTTTNQQKLLDLLGNISPQKIYTPWAHDNHPDHIDTTLLLAAALQKYQPDTDIWQYEVWSPLVPNYFLPIGEVLTHKQALMEAYRTQLDSRQYMAGILGLNTYRGLQAGCTGPAEAYLALAKKEFLEIANRS